MGNICVRSGSLILFFALLMGICRSSLSGSERTHTPEYLFYQANSLYEEGEYEQAIARYTLVLDQGLESGDLYYNLGNCYFKQGERGKAVVNYERARRLRPRDSDLKSNYDYAVSLIKGKVPEIRRIWPVRLIHKISRQFTINELSLFLSLLYVTAVAVLIAGLFLAVVKRYLTPVLILLVAGSAVNAGCLHRRISLLGREAVVIVETVDSRFEPRPGATTYFTLPEGMKVTVVEPRKDWYKIKRADGKIAWVERESLEII